MEVLKSDPAFLAELEKIRNDLSLTQIYYVKSYGPEMYFGARGGNADPAEICNRIGEALHLFGIKNIDEQPIVVRVLSSPRQEVEKLITELEPYIAADGGSITVKEIKETEGLVILSLHGSCSGCPSSVMTLRHGIENLLKRYLPWVVRVEPDQDPVEPDFGFRLEPDEKGGD